MRIKVGQLLSGWSGLWLSKQANAAVLEIHAR